LFLRKDNTTLAIILAIIFLLKSFLHFFINYRLYQYTSLNQSNIDKLKQFYEVEAFATNTLLFIITFYIHKPNLLKYNNYIFIIYIYIKWEFYNLTMIM
jgi:hypothetical protein